MLETFVPMRAWFDRNSKPVTFITEEVFETEPEAEREAIAECPDVDGAIDEARRFRAALADALQCCVADLLTDVAAEVLGREVLLAPCDVGSIVHRAIARYDMQPLGIRVHPDDAPALESLGIAVIADDSLRGGDAIIETKHGSVDASLGVRLERVLSRFAQ